MTTKVNLPNGEQGVIGSPAHRLLQRMATSANGYVVRGRGASDKQLLSLSKDGRVKLHVSFEGPRRIIEGAYLTPAGANYVRMLGEAEARAELIANA